MSLVFLSMIHPKEYVSLQSTPKHVERKLKRDAARLAIRMDAQGEDPAFLQVQVPQKKAAQIYQLLLDIYNSELSEADEVFNCNLRVATDIPIDKFWIIYNKETEWASDLADGIFEVDGDLDDLLEEYDLFITDKKSWDEENDMITIESAKLYNMAALAQKFEAIEGVFKIHTHDPDISPDFDIEISNNNDEWNISFTRYWSSLQNTKSHKWIFKVTDTVTFISESGDEFPDWMKCQLISNIESRF